MHIRERIKNVIVNNLVESKLEELSDELLKRYADKAGKQVDTGQTPDNKQLKRIKGIAKAKKRLITRKQGPRTRKDTFEKPPGRGERANTNQPPN